MHEKQTLMVSTITWSILFFLLAPLSAALTEWWHQWELILVVNVVLCVCFSDWGTGAHATPLHSSEWPSGGPHPRVIQSAVHPPGNRPPAHPSKTSVALPWWIHAPVLLSSDSLWCLIPSWLCPPSVHRAARPVMNIQRSAYLTGLSLFSKPLGMILQLQKTHSMNLLLSCFVSLSFLYSLSLIYIKYLALQKYYIWLYIQMIWGLCTWEFFHTWVSAPFITTTNNVFGCVWGFFVVDLLIC